MLVFSKYFYTACITSYFTFFLMDKFGVSVQTSQLCLFVFLAAFAIGTVAGGMLGDKFGRKYVIWFSILGAAPFAIAMPFVNFTWTIIFTFLSGLIIASAFSSIVVYATDLMPDKVGLIAGIFFGLMFGLGGLGSAFFGWLADKTSIEFIFQVSAFLPLLGIIAGFLPNTQKRSVEVWSVKMNYTFMSFLTAKFKLIIFWCQFCSVICHFCQYLFTPNRQIELAHNLLIYRVKAEAERARGTIRTLSNDIWGFLEILEPRKPKQSLF